MECAEYPSSIMMKLPTCIFLILKLFWSNQTITRLSDIGYVGELCPGRKRLHPGATIPIWSGYPSVLVVWFVPQRPSAPTKFWGVIRYRPLFGGRRPPGPDYVRCLGMEMMFEKDIKSDWWTSIYLQKAVAALGRDGRWGTRSKTNRCSGDHLRSFQCNKCW